LEIPREIIGYLGLNPKRKGDRKDIRGCWCNGERDAESRV